MSDLGQREGRKQAYIPDSISFTLLILRFPMTDILVVGSISQRDADDRTDASGPSWRSLIARIALQKVKSATKLNFDENSSSQSRPREF